MGLTQINAPTEEPVTLEDAKAFCRVIHDGENSLFLGFIKAARQHIEEMLNRSIAERTYRLTLDAFSDRIELPHGPVKSVRSVEYIDHAGDTQTVAPTDYSLDLEDPRPAVVINSGASWPSTLDAINAVSITYEAGELPDKGDDLWAAILFQVDHFYMRAEGEAAPVIERLVAPYRRVL